MKQYSGKTINTGTAIAKVFAIRNESMEIKKVEKCDSAVEIGRLEEAKASVSAELQIKKANAEKTYGSESAAIIDTHIMLLSDEADESLIGRTKAYLESNGLNAEYALDVVGAEIKAEFLSAETDYLRARSDDISHLVSMLLANLLHIENNESLTEPSIIAAVELSPETLTALNPEMLCGIVTANTSPLSHTAILAKNLNIPFLTDIKLTEPIEDGTIVAIDGETAEFIVDPYEETVKNLEEKIKTEKENNEKIAVNVKDFIAQSPVLLCANIGKPEEAEKAKENFAAGIGLMRSEFLFMDRDDLPGEEEQYDTYVKVLDAMGGKPVCIRTIDIGADKDARCLNLKKENNPALGLRGIRISFAKPEIFETQLRALLRAAYNRNLEIMFPMITAEWEVKKALEFVDKVAGELEKEKKEYAIPRIGIMVETPAAVLAMGELSKLVDFVSIGTNDLTQYTLGLDRTADDLGDYYNPKHEAVLELIEKTVKEAKKAGIRVGICGELGADTSLTKRFYKMGVDELSMAPAKIPFVAAKLNEIKEEKKGPDFLGIQAPAEGFLVEMKDIPDEAFSSGALGACLGIDPENGLITAPISGTVTMIAKTKHAFSIKADDGTEVLVHVGIDTVELGGRGFDVKVKEGQAVSVGDEILECNIELIKSEGFSPIVVTVLL